MKGIQTIAYVVMAKRVINRSTMPKICKAVGDKIYFTQEDAEQARKEATDSVGIDCFKVFEIFVEVVREI